MRGYRCATCEKVFDPNKHELCPACSTAVAPSVLTRIERKTTAQRLRSEGMFHYNDRCHEDDAWSESYGASTHRAAVRAHESKLRQTYASHRPADEPTRPAGAVFNQSGNASSAEAGNALPAFHAQNQIGSANPTRLSNADPAANAPAASSGVNPTRLSNANPNSYRVQTRKIGKQDKSKRSGGIGVVLLWLILLLLRVLFD